MLGRVLLVPALTVSLALRLRPFVDRIASRPFSPSNDARSVHGGGNGGARARLRPGLRQRPGPADRWDVGALAAFSVVLVRGTGCAARRACIRPSDSRCLFSIARARPRTDSVDAAARWLRPDARHRQLRRKACAQRQGHPAAGAAGLQGCCRLSLRSANVDRLEHVAPRFLHRNLARVRFPPPPFSRCFARFARVMRATRACPRTVLSARRGLVRADACRAVVGRARHVGRGCRSGRVVRHSQVPGSDPRPCPA